MKINLSKYGKKGQKSKIQIDRFDVWSLDHTLAGIILPCLLQLKSTKHGVPSEFVEVGGEDYVEQLSFDFYKETNSEAWNIGAKRWDDVMDKMIWSFYQIAYVDIDKLYHHGKADYSWVKSDTKFINPLTNKTEDTFKMVEKPTSTHWYDAEGARVHMERIQEGIELFAKYYHNLWD